MTSRTEMSVPLKACSGTMIKVWCGLPQLVGQSVYAGERLPPLPTYHSTRKFCGYTWSELVANGGMLLFGLQEKLPVTTISNRLASCRVATVDSNEVSEDSHCAIKTLKLVHL